MRRVLLVVRQDFVIEPREGRAIGDAVATMAERAELRDATLTPSELREAVTSMLRLLQAYRAALESTGG